MNLRRFCFAAFCAGFGQVQGQGSSSQSGAPAPIQQQITDGPYFNAFFSDNNITDAHVVVTSPLPDSNLTIIGPRLIVAWPAGNSGICTFFQPTDGPNGTLAISLVNSTIGQPLAGYRNDISNNAYPYVGVQGVLSFNASTTLTVPVLGSIRTIRDFTEGPSLLRPLIQDAINVTRYNGTGASLSRMWLDNSTVTTLTLVPWQNKQSNISIDNGTISFGAGFYHFTASFNYPQLTQLTPHQVLNNASQGLIANQTADTTSLSFLSYTEKLLAGTWRFLTYFGRDSMITALLMRDTLSAGNASALEAVIGAVLERVNRTSGAVCHEETIGDYATYTNIQNGLYSTDAGCTYQMIDTDFYLPVLMAEYFSQYPDRVQPLLSRQAGSVDTMNKNLTYGDLALVNAQKIMNTTAAFQKNQTVQNLLHLHADQPVGQWRDSNYGIGNGRIPFDVNCALAPAALNGLSILAGIPGIFPNTTAQSWQTAAAARAQVWTDNTLRFFEIDQTISETSDNLAKFTKQSTFYDGPTNNETLATYSSNDTVTYYAISLNGTTNDTAIASQKIPILHTDTCFRLFLLNDTNDAHLTPFINATAQSILRPFPAGLTTTSGMIVANPALSGNDVLIANFTNSAYHGTVIWSWQLAMMAKGLERQLVRCNVSNSSSSTSSSDCSSKPTATTVPGFCSDATVYNTTVAAYNYLWDTIEASSAQLESEVWSWMWNNDTQKYVTTPLGSLPPPPGVSSGTESDVRQLWSLSFLAVKRNQAIKWFA